MNRCQKCQAELPAEARFCNKCGSPRVFADSKPVTSTSTPEDLAKKTFEAIVSTNDTPLASLHPTRSIQPGVKRVPEAAKEGNKAPSDPAQPTLATRSDDKGAKTPTPKVSPDREGEQPKPTPLPTSIKVTILPEASNSPSTQPRSASRPEAVQPAVTPEAPRPTPATPKPTSQLNAPATSTPVTPKPTVPPATPKTAALPETSRNTPATPKPAVPPDAPKTTTPPEASRSTPATATSSTQPAQTRPTIPPVLPGQATMSEPPKSTTQSTASKPTQQLNKPKSSAQPAEVPSAAASAEKPKPQPLSEAHRPTASQPKQQVDALTPTIPLDLPKSAAQPVVLKTQIWTEPSKPASLLPETPQPEILAAKPSAATQPNTVRPAAQAKPDAAQPVLPQSPQPVRPAIQAGTPANKSEPSKPDQSQTNTPMQTRGKPVSPGIVRPISVTSSSRPPAPIAKAGKTQPTQGNTSPPIPPHLAALAAKKPTPLPPQRITPPPVPTEKQALDISEQVTRKDAAILAQQLWSASNTSLSPTIQRGEIIRTSTLPPQRRRPDNVDELPIELEDLPVDALPTGRVAAEPRRNSPSLAATSRVAEHWRNSWRDRQHAEAGPAVGVSRGQASVPTPLTTMQHSIARMRAIVLNKQQTQQSRNSNFGFWMTLFLMLCLIGGLGTYIISTFLTASSLGAAHIVHPGGIAYPSLTVKGTQTSGVAIGQLLQLHGEQFDAHDTITFYLDTTTQIMGPHGKPLSVQVNNAGRFDISLPVDLNWSVGTHLIQAQDTRTHQTAYVNIQVILKTKPETSSPNLALSTKLLSFTAIFGEGNPTSQRITFTNTSGQQLQWSVTTTADNNLSWLVIDQDQTDSTVNSDQQDTLNVGILTTGLVPSHKPYTGHILFTINGKELLTLPVQLTVQNPSIEMSFIPNPVIAHLGQNGTCGTTTTLTLINLSDETVTWTVKPDGNIASNIKFYDSLGKPIKVPGGFLYPAGQTDPSGQRIDIVVLTLQCSGVKPGMHYHVSIYANNQQNSTDVIIQ